MRNNKIGYSMFGYLFIAWAGIAIGVGVCTKNIPYPLVLYFAYLIVVGVWFGKNYLTKSNL